MASGTDGIVSDTGLYLDCMQNFAGMLEYLLSWIWVDELTIRANGGAVFTVKALPFIVDDKEILFQSLRIS